MRKTRKEKQKQKHYHNHCITTPCKNHKQTTNRTGISLDETLTSSLKVTFLDNGSKIEYFLDQDLKRKHYTTKEALELIRERKEGIRNSPISGNW